MRPRSPDAPRIPAELSSLVDDGGPVDEGVYHRVTLRGGAAGGVKAMAVTVEAVRGEKLELSGARLARLSLLDVELRGGSLANADLQDGSWRRVVVSDMRLTGASWVNARLDHVTFRDCAMNLSAFTASRLRRVAFVDCRR